MFRLNYGCNGNKGANRTRNGLPAPFTSHPGALKPGPVLRLRAEGRRSKALIQSPVVQPKAVGRYTHFLTFVKKS